MAPTDRDTEVVATPTRPVLLAYDGSELAALAIEQAGRQWPAGRDALVLRMAVGRCRLHPDQ